ncbi:uncharacterized protein [Delphinus delphis]|uniref:uncharacterized protein n=1 Tax=Delphinus delphis TaxID=9728 RepID=UPI003750F926
MSSGKGLAGDDHFRRKIFNQRTTKPPHLRKLRKAHYATVSRLPEPQTSKSRETHPGAEVSAGNAAPPTPARDEPRPASSSDSGPGLPPGSSQPGKRRSYLSSAPSYRAVGGGGRRRGLPARQPNSLVRLLRLSLSGSAPRTSSSCTSGVRRRLKRHCAHVGGGCDKPEGGGAWSLGRFLWRLLNNGKEQATNTWNNMNEPQNIKLSERSLACKKGFLE